MTDRAEQIIKVIEKKNKGNIMLFDDIYIAEQLVIKYPFPYVMGMAKSKKVKTMSTLVILSEKSVKQDTQVFEPDLKVDNSGNNIYKTLLEEFKKNDNLLTAYEAKMFTAIAKTYPTSVVKASIKVCNDNHVTNLKYLLAVCASTFRAEQEVTEQMERLAKKMADDSAIISSTGELTDEEAERIRQEAELWDF